MSLSNTSTASAGSARGASNASPAKDKQLMRLVIQLLRPYRGWLLIVFIAMLVEIAGYVLRHLGRSSSSSTMHLGTTSCRNGLLGRTITASDVTLSASHYLQKSPLSSLPYSAR